MGMERFTLAAFTTRRGAVTNTAPGVDGNRLGMGIDLAQCTLSTASPDPTLVFCQRRL